VSIHRLLSLLHSNLVAMVPLWGLGSGRPGLLPADTALAAGWQRLSFARAACLRSAKLAAQLLAEHRSQVSKMTA
jgi:hypothetical protein